MKDIWQLGWAIAWRAYLGLFVLVFAVLMPPAVLLTVIWPADVVIPFGVSRADAIRVMLIVGVVPLLGVSVRRALLHSGTVQEIARRLLLRAGQRGEEPHA